MGWLPIAGLALGAVGSLVGARQQASAAKAQAKQADQDAEDEATSNAIRTGQRSRERDALIASQRAAYGANGISSDIGTPLAMFGSTAAMYADDQFNDSFNRKRKVNAFAVNAASARQSASNAWTSSLFDIGTSVVDYGVRR